MCNCFQLHVVHSSFASPYLVFLPALFLPLVTAPPAVWPCRRRIRWSSSYHCSATVSSCLLLTVQCFFHVFLVWMTINSNRKSSNQLEIYQKFAHKLSWNACIWHEPVDPKFCGQWRNLLDQSKWTQAYVRRLARLMSYIHYKSDYRQDCHMGKTAQQCRSGLFQDSDLQGILKIRNQLRESFMHLRKPNICLHLLDVQEANISIPQFYRIIDHVVKCWTANGWIACAWFHGMWSLTIYVHRTIPNHKPNRQRETVAM